MDMLAYKTNLGQITAIADSEGLLELFFEKEKNLAHGFLKPKNKILIDTKNWLDIYFQGEKPNFNLPLKPKGTPFQLMVWEILSSIPYSSTVTYGEIAQIIASKKGIKKMSAQAVGNAVGSNKISIIIPCHRVIAKNSLGGYHWGLDIKKELLKLEKVPLDFGS